MCGIFGFVSKKPIETVKAFRVLQKLEKHQYLNEPKPVGGYGAGIAVITSSGTVLLEKVGRVNGSPAEQLSKMCRLSSASVLLGHVRMPSPWFMETAQFRETAQPYMAQCLSRFKIISAHNGNVANYKAIREKLGEKHVFESERVELIDSEVIPHLFEELLNEKADWQDALDAFFSTIEGSNTTALLQIENKRFLLHLIHKGRTRGLTVWKNEKGEVVFCSRKEPLMEEFSEVLEKDSFREQLSISYGEEGNVKMSFAFTL
jgi:glucosamine 6-phosphate synthetase-like amidotransferase/phosphosugar isomerase protein